MSPQIDAETIREGRKFTREAADPRVFPAVVAFVAFALCGLLIYWQRQDGRERDAALVAALEKNTAAIERSAAANTAAIERMLDLLRTTDRRQR